MRIGLVGCVKSKQSALAPARDLYTSALFVGRRRWVESTCDRWFILSAKHGLIEPDELLEPYDVAMKDVSRPLRRTWSEQVLADLDDRVRSLGAHTFEIHAGADYCDWGLVAGLEHAGATVVRPMAGLAFGRQLSRYAEGSAADMVGSQSVDDGVADGPGHRIPSGGSSAAPPASRVVERREAVVRFHLLLGELADRLGGARTLADVTGRSGWPSAGVYFFSEPGEVREGGGPRVVRIGTHALTETSKTTLWSRLRAHRGSVNGGGNHRTSISASTSARRCWRVVNIRRRLQPGAGGASLGPRPEASSRGWNTRCLTTSVGCRSCGRRSTTARIVARSKWEPSHS